MKKIKTIVLPTIVIIALLILVIGFSYASFVYSKLGSELNSITLGGMVMSMNEQASFEINNAFYVDDEVGKVQTDKYQFTIQARSKSASIINYEIVAVKESGSTLSDQYVTLYLTEGEMEAEVLVPTPYKPITAQTEIGSPAGSMILLSDSISLGPTNDNVIKDYTFRMWINNTIPTEELEVAKTFKVRLNLYAKQLTVK